MRYCGLVICIMILMMGCHKEQLPIEELERSLPGRWKIESITFNKLYSSAVYKGDTIQEGQVLKNIGILEFPNFNADSLLVTNGTNASLICELEMDSEVFDFRIDYFTVGAEKYFGAFRLPDYNNVNSENSSFLEGTLLLNRNSYIRILNADTVIIEPANGEYLIQLIRI